MEESDYGGSMGSKEYNDFLEEAGELVSSLNRMNVSFAEDDELKIDDADMLKAYIQSPDEAADIEERVKEFRDRYFS